MNRRNHAFAFVAAFLMLAAPIACVTLSEDETEVEATPGFVAGFVVGSIVGGVIGYWAGVNFGSNANDGVSEQSRNGEANALITGLAYGSSAISNALENYAQIWLLTEEHWIRQAELAATGNWSDGASYDPYAVLIDSGVYYNASYMIGNAAVQLQEQFDTAAKRIENWGSIEEYSDGKLRLEISVGDSAISADSNDELRVGMGTAIRNVSSGSDAVYYAGGPIWVSQACTITSASGHSIPLTRGWNDFGDIESFQHADVYYLAPGISFLGYFDQIIDPRAAVLQTGLVATSGDEILFVTTDGNSLSTGSQTGIPMTDSSGGYSGLTVKIVTQEGETFSCDMTSILAYYHSLLDSIRDVQSNANRSARVMWNIYNDLGASCAYLTTLSLPETYNNVQWTDDQLQMVTYLMMEQMADYWDSYGDLKTTDYMMTKDSFTLYCRGSIQIFDPSGGGTYEYASGVAFTPIFYKDTTLSTGSNTTSDYCFIVVWGDCSSLGRFDVASMEDAQIVYAPARSVLNISEMYHDGSPTTSVDLDCTDVEWIDPHRIEDPGPVPVVETNDLAEILRLAFILIGAGLIVYGVSKGSWIWLGIGLAFIVIGFLFSDVIANALETYLGWRALWPF